MNLNIFPKIFRFFLYPLYSINLYITIATSIATRAKYHEAINIIEMQRKTPISDKILKAKFSFLVLDRRREFAFYQ
jgi:hypothetical protein